MSLLTWNLCQITNDLNKNPISWPHLFYRWKHYTWMPNVQGPDGRKTVILAGETEHTWQKVMGWGVNEGSPVSPIGERQKTEWGRCLQAGAQPNKGLAEAERCKSSAGVNSFLRGDCFRTRTLQCYAQTSWILSPIDSWTESFFKFLWSDLLWAQLISIKYLLSICCVQIRTIYARTKQSDSGLSIF